MTDVPLENRPSGRRRPRRVAVPAAVGVLFGLPAASPAAARCPSCFGTGFDGPLVDAIGLAMLALLGIVVLVFAGIIKFFSHMARRARTLEQVGYDDRASGDGHHQPALPASYLR